MENQMPTAYGYTELRLHFPGVLHSLIYNQRFMEQKTQA